jgi:hypothetical protein
MEELFTIIGKLYFDLVRSQSIIESLKKELQTKNSTTDILDQK